MDNKYLKKITSIMEDIGLPRTHINEASVPSDKSNKKPVKNVKAPKPGYPATDAFDPTSKNGMSNAIASEFFARARALATTTHFAHLSTDSYSEHVALNTFYEDIIEAVDKFCEAFIGAYGKFITLPPISADMQIAVDAIIEFRDWIAENRESITDDSSLQNIIDESVELCNTTIYKLQKLS